ncbi:MAG TPA: type II toxin-antitoxin system ParD family antitoxin [Pirellulales bacterium]|nr:type II toxin-antitoxin system ParD family antitoxin [Pirellulales bacterium]
MDTMNIALPTGLKEFAQTRVAEGGYSSVSEYVRELIRADQKEAAQARMESEVLKGLQSGESTPMTSLDWERLRNELRQRHAKR